MRNPAKFVLVGLVSIAIGAVASSAFANPPGCRNMEGGMMFQGDPSGGDKGKFAKFIEKRQTELHNKLKLTAEQEPAWNTFTEKMKATLPQGRPNWEEMSKLNTPERMDKMLARMKEGEKQMETRAATIKAFYATLTPEQRKVFDEQSPPHGRRFR
jgi:periplasmic protein CpxP/Spy